MTRLAIVILNYNGEKLLRQFLPSVVLHSPEASIYVADNGSTDGSILWLRLHFPQVSILELGNNYGFCGGYNRALRQISAEYYVLLNSDVEVTSLWLQPLMSILDSNPTVAAVQPKILSFRNKNHFEYAGAGGGFLDSMGYPFCRGRVFDHVEEDQGQYNDERAIFWATGACMMIRSGKFHQHGGFDEDLFAHMEEIDLCWKLNRSHDLVFYSGQSTVYHLGAGTLDYHHPQKTYLNFRNGLSLIFKHLDTGELIYKLPLRLMLDWMAAVLFLFQGQGQNFKSVVLAHVHFVTHWKSLKVKRNLVRKANRTYPRKNIHPGLIVFDYYLRNKKTFQV
ncbi:MAG: glycosyltransferase family 2 protein [Cyclobacteriaceae bacterium]